MACSCRSSSLRKFVTGLVQVHQPGASLPSAQFLRSSSASTSLTNFRPAVAHGATIARANGVIGRGGSRGLHTEAQTEESVEVEENSTSTVQPKKPRGRPKKLKEPSVPTPEDEDDPALPPSESIADAEVKPKRSRGRPKSLEDPAPAVHETEDDPASGVELRKPRGRPKKLEKAPLATEDIEGSSGADAQPKKARGRPKKLEEPSLIALEVDDGAGSSAEPKESRDGEEASEESLTVPEGEDGSVVVSEEQPVVSDVKPKKARGRPKKLEEPSPTAPDVDDSVVASEEPAADSDVEPTMAQDGPMESEDASTAGPEVENGPSPALGKQPGKAKSKPKKPRAKPQKSPLSKNARKKLRSKLAEEALGGSDMFGEGEEEGDGEASRAFGTNYPEGELAYETGEQPTPRETEEVQTRDEVSISEEEDDYVDSMSPGLLGMEASDDGAPKKKMTSPVDRVRPEKKKKLREQASKLANSKAERLLRDNRPEWQKQKEALKAKFPEGWRPIKRLSPDAMAGIRALNAQFPDTYNSEHLSKRFEVSPEAIRRILRSKWTPSAETEEKRQERWHRRGLQVWERKAALGIKPPRRWRDEGITRDPGFQYRKREARERERQWEEDEREKYREYRASLGKGAGSDFGQ